MSNYQSKVEYVEQLIKEFDLPPDNIGTDGKFSLLVKACEYVKQEMNDLLPEFSPVRRLLAYILANKVYDFGHDFMIAADFINQMVRDSFFLAYQMAKLAYTPIDKRLRKFIDEVLYLAERAGNQTFISELNEAISLLES